MDEETGLYYYGARYLDPKMSRWLSTDPAMGEYVPGPGMSPNKLGGMGGVYNVVNLHTYHYAANNPVRYTDPDGRMNDDGTGNDPTGGVGKKYVIIAMFPGGGNENVGTTFVDAANTRKNEIESSSGFNQNKDTVSVFNIDSIDKFKNILDTGNIDQLDVFSHGGEQHLVVGSGEGSGKRELLYADDLKNFNRNAFNAGASINFFGCKTASEKSLNFFQKAFGKKTIADSFADYFRGASVTGYTGGAIAVPSPNAEIDPNFIHQRGDPVWYKTWGGSRTYKYDK
ncbi:DUF4347 domain-containing protein [Breznakiella homolactica]|uniref:DUF4347 domain-containing protein n=2 Tax=Breznakiella homolactica TaxID=2798577 RepID=A0A7T8BBM1_9SPIR|nr:DUF4347 domain-containing protein [Breznakiella homolactica]